MFRYLVGTRRYDYYPTYGNGLAETRSYDQDYRLTSLTDPGVLSWTLGYNADDDITAITDNLTSVNSQSLNYDALNRLSTATGNYGNLSYGYDADGNRTQLNVNTVLTNYTYGTSNNRLTKVNAIARSYDADGSTTHDGTYVYAYDDSERLASLTKTSTTASYLYNGLGQRVEKTVNGVTTVYVYDESGHLIGEYTPSGTLIAEHIWLNGQPIGVITPNGLYYVQTDQLGTPRDITNASKQLVWEWSSNPFGTTAPNQNPSGLGTFAYNLRFPGQYYDAETGHDYNYFRYYDPTIGRFISSDPIGLRGGVNTYAYALNNPLSFSDPTGTAVYIYSDQVTGLTSPASDHLYLMLVPDNPQDFANEGGWLPLGNGDIWASLSAHPEFGLFGNLTFTPDYSGNDFGGLYRATVRPPCGESDTQFIQALIHAADFYGDNLPYSYPNFLTGQMAPGTYNSNSFVSGIITAAGGVPPPLPSNNTYQVPGYQNPIP